MIQFTVPRNGSTTKVIITITVVAVGNGGGTGQTPTNVSVPELPYSSQTPGLLAPHEPATNCTPEWGKSYTQAGALALINYCRAQEGVGPLRLPRNFASLTAPQQMLVLVNLERVSRGEAPLVGLSPSINQDAQQGAAGQFDPGGGVGGILVVGAYSALDADYAWMYDDGYGSDNPDCHAPDDPSCWGHRNIILFDGSWITYVGGAGFKTIGRGAGSYAFVMGDYNNGPLAFRWVHELAYFPTPPGPEPLATPIMDGNRSLASGSFR